MIIFIFQFIHYYKFLKYLRKNRPDIIKELGRKSIFFKKPVLPTYTVLRYCLDINDKDPKIRNFKRGYIAFIIILIILMIISFNYF